MLVGVILFAFICVANSAPQSNENGVPLFKWDENERNKLHVTFPDGFTDTVNLQHSYPEDVALNEERAKDSGWCIYNGHFESDIDAFIAVNGCPGSRTLAVGISSSRLNGHLFKVDNDQVSRVSGLGVGSTADAITPPDLELDVPVEELREDRALPSLLKLNLFYLYDDNFNTKFGSNSEAAMKRVTNLASSTFQFPTLGTKVQLNVVGYNKVSGQYLAAEKDINKVGGIIGDAANSSINTYVLFGNENAVNGTLGIAYSGTVCNPLTMIQFKTAIVEYTIDDSLTAHVLSHELGHSLNMRHDFVNSTTPRKDSKGNTCTNINAVMDYDQGFYDKWSTCSVEDLKKLQNEEIAQSGKFCIDAGTTTTPSDPGTNPTSTTNAPTTTTTDAPDDCVDQEPHGKSWCSLVIPDYISLCSEFDYISYICQKSCKSCGLWQ